MSAGPTYSPQEQAQIRAELDRILASERLVNAHRISSLLRYVVEEALAGRRDRIKAFSIAQDVFDRDASFDQQRDPIVRVEASRLRKCLVEYYESCGQDSAVRIDIPKGGYAPTFTRKNAAVATPRRRSVRPLIYALVVLVFFLALWSVWHQVSRDSSMDDESQSAFLAVLPLNYNADDIRAADLAANLVDSTITLLTGIPQLSVMAHSSMMEFDQEQVSIRELRDEFGITHILRGSIETMNDMLQIRIQLIDTETLETMWSDSLKGKTTDVWQLQDELAEKLLSALSIELKSSERAHMLSRYTENTEALTLYRHGLFMILPPSETKRVQAARQLFGRVREIDSEFAGGYAGAAWSYALPVLFHNTATPAEYLAQALDLAQQAIRVDPGFGAGYAVLGFSQALAGDKVEALENVRLAGAIQPGDAFVHFLKGVTFILSGIPEQSFAPLQEAIRLNPIEKRAPYLNVYAIGRYANREYQSTLDIIDSNLDRQGPHGPHMDTFRAAAYAQLGEQEKASAIIQDLMSKAPDYPYAAWLESWLGQGEHQQSTLHKLSSSGLPLPSELSR